MATKKRVNSILSKVKGKVAWASMPRGRLSMAHLRVDYRKLGDDWGALNIAAKSYLDARLDQMLALYGMVTSGPQAMLTHAASAWATSQYLHAQGIACGDMGMVRDAIRMADSAAKHERWASELLATEAQVLLKHTGTPKHDDMLEQFTERDAPAIIAAETARREPINAYVARKKVEQKEREANMDKGILPPEIYAIRGKRPADPYVSQGPYVGTGTIGRDGSDVSRDDAEGEGGTGEG